MFGEYGMESAVVISAIERGARSWDKGMLEAMLREAEKYKPGVDAAIADSYDALTIRRRHYYENRQIQYLVNRLAKEYPNTYREMRPIVFNIFKLIAEMLSQVYRYDTPRKALANGEEDEAATEELSKPLREMRLQMRIAEAERRAQISGAQLLQVWDSEVEERMVLRTFWPNDVHVIPNPGAPTSLQHAYMVALRTMGPTMDKWFEVWTRAADENAWDVVRMSDKGDREEVLEGQWTLPLPMAMLYSSPPEGGVFPCTGQDLITAQDSVNLAWTELNHVIKHQAHSILYHAGVSDEDQVVGPGYVFRMQQGDQFGSVDQNPKIREMVEAVEAQLRTLAVSLRMNPDAFATSPPPPQSGIARQIQNIAQSEARKERIAYATEMEVGQLLPAIAAVWDNSGRGSVQLSTENRGWSISVPDEPTYEDPDRKQMRALTAKAEGWIDNARAAYEAGWYGSLDEAKAALEAMAEERGQQFAPARQELQTIGQRLAARRGE